MTLHDLLVGGLELGKLLALLLGMAFCLKGVMR